MANRARVTVRDRGYNALLRRARALEGGGQLTVGVHPREGGMHYPEGQTVSQVARLHESGTRHMVARPFLTYWFTRAGGSRRIRDATRRALVGYLDTGADPRRALERAGERYVAQVRATFDLMRPLRLSTIRRKRSSRVLYESGMLWRAVGYRVRVGRRG